MAFLDNSGDIILDAVLTEVGRKRLTQATRLGGNNARITKFALGDDEINYAEYNLNSPSGSNYADLEILQTPILEAFSMGNAGINYGLMTITNTEILYMPSLKLNEKSTAAFPALQKYGSIFVLAVNQETKDSLINSENLTAQQVGLAYGASTSNFIVVEGGLNTTELSKTAANQQTYITNKRVHNSRFNIGVDRRLHGAVFTSTGGKFSNLLSNNTDQRSNFVLTSAGVISSGARTIGVKNYDIFAASGIRNAIYQPQSGGSATDYSVIAGPGDSVVAYMFNVKSNLRATSTGVRDILYTQIGSINVLSSTLFGVGSRKYDYIDTMTYVYGKSTGAIISIPVRLIRYVGL